MIGVAIPCYINHFSLLPSLIDNISKSTVPPDQIAVSCSSWTHNHRTNTTYNGVPVSIQYSKKVLNQATNRNIAGGMLNTLLISFIDADDLMHPSRLEYVIRAFKEGPYHAIYHDYTWEPNSHYSTPFESMDDFNLVLNPVVPDPTTVGLKVQDSSYALHHAHVTVRRDVFNRFKFDESWKAYRMEDSLYGRKLAESGVSLGYLANKLTRYIFTPTQ
jgi:hypothetical protein